MSPSNQRLLTCYADFGKTLVDAVPTAELAEGEVRLKIDRFGLTTNNISYAVFGDSIGYWQVFPTARVGYGHMPVWGYADVAESRATGIAQGARVWGYLPMAGELTVQADKVTRYSFVDAAPHRQAVPQVYSRYTFCSEDPFYRAELEGVATIYRPLFVTSYTAVDFLRENQFFGARRILVSSASSKTAYGIASCLEGDDIPVVGMTGARNREFVAGLGCYDTVLGYDELEQISPGEPTLYIDLASDPRLRERVHYHFGDTLAYDCLVGATQGTSLSHGPDLPGPPPRFFFTAERLDRHRKQGTLRAFLNRFETDQLAFYERAVSPEHPWIRLVEQQGLEAAGRIVRELADGRGGPGLGHIVRL